jgi:hypothetical protein
MRGNPISIEIANVMIKDREEPDRFVFKVLTPERDRSCAYFS